ncbi:ribonuclease HII [Candidatus Woesearchaeota archaeon]|nr:ribonuclease HII [Candidatus Woesearchaeota archaeon]
MPLGPVIGPMVMAGVMIEEGEEDKLAKMGVKDSKMLSPKAREIMFDLVKSNCSNYKTLIVDVNMVDAALATDDMNLNKLEAQKMAEVINALEPDRAIIDCPSNNIPAFVSYLRKHIKNKNIEIIAEHKADENHLVVGAASILAKVTRDREIEKIKNKIGVDFGSGYPSDPRTVAFVEKNWNKHPSIFRKSWSSYRKYVEKFKNKSLGDF